MAYTPEALSEVRAFNKHRTRQRPPVEQDGYASDEMLGWVKHRARHKYPLISIVYVPEEIPVKLQLVAWAKAIMVLDASEVLIRDLIERELAGRTGTKAGPNALLIARQLSANISVIRLDAIKLAFRLLRDWLGNQPILDVSLARWAKSFADKDAQTISSAIQTGLIAGLDNTEIARRVVGSMGLNGVDGVTEFTRHKIAHLGRAAIKESLARKEG